MFVYMGSIQGPAIPVLVSPLISFNDVCVDHWTTSKDVRLAQGQGHHVKPGSTKRDTMVIAMWDAKL